MYDPQQLAPTRPSPRKGFLSRRVAIIVFVLILLAGLASAVLRRGPSATTGSAGLPATARVAAVESPQAAPAVKVPGIDEALLGRNWAYQLLPGRLPVERVDELRWGQTASAVLQPKGQFFVVGIALQNNAKQSSQINPWDFELRDGAGVVYKATVNGLLNSALERTYDLKAVGSSGTHDVPPGVPISAALVFDINPDARDLSLYLVQERRSIPLE